jgi:predicted ATPase
MGARPHPPRALYRSYLQQSHIFVAVYWQSYGWVAPEESISGLEDEYVLSEGLPKLLYVKEPAPDREPTLASLLKRIQADDVASYRSFRSAEELSRLVSDDLMLLLSERFQTTTAGRERARGTVELQFWPPPQPLTHILGREREVGALEALIDGSSRLIVVTGAGGVGKTRLVIEVARRRAAEDPVDVHFVSLIPIEAPELVLAQIAASLGIQVEGTQRPVDALRDHLGDRRLLLVLDNFEHVSPAAVELPRLLAACPRLQLLVTSRQVLRLRGETDFALEPLPVPAPASAAARVRANATVRLFVERAQAAQPAFRLTADNVESVAEICRRLDGVPLAVELAAARVRLLPPKLLLERLGTRLDLLGAGAADLPERQRTLRSAIDWSYQLLAAGERALFARLAVFVDGWTLEAVETVCGDASEDVLETVFSLLEKSLLVVVDPAVTDQPRMRMLVPVREFAEEQLIARGEHVALRRRHADYYLRLVEESGGKLRTGEQGVWSRALEKEAGNLRAAARWWLDGGDGESLARFAFATFLQYWLTGGLQEFDALVRAAAPAADRMPDRLHGRFRVIQAYLALERGRADEALRAAREALSLFGADGAEADITLAKLVQAETLALSDPSQAATVVASIVARPGLHDDAWLWAWTEWTQGGLDLLAGNADEARRHLEQALALGREIGSWQIAGQALARLAFVALSQKRSDQAASLFAESADCFRRIHHREGLAICLQGLASLLAISGQALAAVRALAAVVATRSVIGVPPWPTYAPSIETLRAELETAVGDRFATNWSRGETTDIYTAIDDAVSGLSQSAQVGASTDTAANL